jgi:hypothetical protein
MTIDNNMTAYFDRMNLMSKGKDLNSLQKSTGYEQVELRSQYHSHFAYTEINAPEAFTLEPFSGRSTP